MRTNDQRKMLFLYPENLSSHDLKKLKDIYSLSEDLAYIINEVNDFIKVIYDKYLTKTVKSVPKVECSSVSNHSILINQFHNVRICLVKHNDVDYSSSYDKVIKMYESNEQDISHLISLTIDSNIKDNCIKWNYDEKSKFDVNIETNLSQLNIVLISIMMDIILYRHFNLSETLKKRKEFSILKRNYIIDINKSNDIQKIYKSSLTELQKMKYLSICYPRVFAFFTIGNIELDDLVKVLINNYWKLITQTIFLNINLQNNYIMYDKENEYKNFPKDIQIQISDIIPKFCYTNNAKLPLQLAIKKESSKEEDCYMIKSMDDFLRLREDEFNYFNLNVIGV